MATLVDVLNNKSKVFLMPKTSGIRDAIGCRMQVIRHIQWPMDYLLGNRKIAVDRQSDKVSSDAVENDQTLTDPSSPVLTITSS